MVDQPKRSCGDCQLCCTLIPVESLGKTAGQRCKHQRFGKGCTLHPNHPLECKLWACMWLESNAPVRRPNHSHYVIDCMLTRTAITYKDSIVYMQVPQIWCDPKYPDAHRDPALRAYLLTLPSCGMALVRYNSVDGLFLIPPNENQGTWEERETNCCKEIT